MRMRGFFLLIFSILFCFSVSGINFSRVNLAWQYDLSFDVKIAHRVVNDTDGLTIFLRISSDSLSDWNYEYLVQDSYESEEHRVLNISTDTLRSSKTQVLLKLMIPEISENFLVLKFSKPERFYFYDVSLNVGGLSFPSIYPVDENGFPIIKNYIKRSGFSWKGNPTFLATVYSESFAPADPPMAEMKSLTPQVDLDTAFYFGDDITFSENKFYNILKDSSSSLGVTMLRVPPYFPEYRQLGELVESMLYITSEQEKKSMLKSKNPKQSFDSFWMNTFSTKSRARNAIRDYYNTVKKVNILFTDFKPGWKTDRGMMYLVFGLPDEVYRNENSEEWYYDNGLAFEFTVISSFFAPRTYTLRRNIDFEELWYTQIANLRR